MNVKELQELLKLYAGNRTVVVRTEDGNYVREAKGTTVVSRTGFLELVLHDERHYVPFLNKKEVSDEKRG